MSKDAGHSVLLPPEPQEGGLIIKPGIKRNPNLDGDSATIEFKVPLPPSENKPARVSLLGLDRLAEAKRRERQQQQQQTPTHEETTSKKKEYEEEPTSKRSKVYSYKDGEAQDLSERRGSSYDNRNRDEKSRHYRERDGEHKSSSTSSSNTPTPHRLYHKDYNKDSRGSSSKSKGIYASSNKQGKLAYPNL